MNENIGFSELDDAIAVASAQLHEQFAAMENQVCEQLAKIWIEADNQTRNAAA